MGGEEPLRLPGRLEPAHNFLSSSRRPVTTLNSVVEALMGPVVSVGGLMGNRLDIATQFVCHDDPWLAELRDQPCYETLGSFGIPARLHKNIKRVTVGIDSPPEPVLYPVDRDHNFVQMPFVIWAGTVPTDASGKVSPKAVDPEADRLAAHDHASLSKQILDIRSAQRKPMVRPNRVGDDLTRMTIALQARHRCWYSHAVAHSKLRLRKQLGNAD